MLRKWVGIDKTVFANCAVAFGNNNKFLYKKLVPFSAALAPSLPLTAAVKKPSVIPFIRFNASAVSAVVNIPPKGLLALPALNSDIPASALSTFTIFAWLFVAVFAASIESQKLPLAPCACAAALVSNISLNIALDLAIPDSSVIALNIEYLGSFISPNSFLITCGGAPVLSITSSTNFPPGKSVKVLDT